MFEQHNQYSPEQSRDLRYSGPAARLGEIYPSLQMIQGNIAQKPNLMRMAEEQALAALANMGLAGLTEQQQTALTESEAAGMAGAAVMESEVSEVPGEPAEAAEFNILSEDDGEDSQAPWMADEEPAGE